MRTVGNAPAGYAGPMRPPVLTALCDLTCPPRCVFCGAGIDAGSICAPCAADLPRPAASCWRCAEPLPLAVPDDLPCTACQQQPPPWSRCIAPFAYAWPVDAALKSLKFHRRLLFAAAFAELLLPVVARMGQADALVPVPLHRWRQAGRGFNQAREVARALAAGGGPPLLDAVVRVRPTQPQSGLGRAARRRNLHGAFRLRRPVHRRRLLLIDDIVTTGETCWHITKLLLAHGARDVQVLAVARAAGGRQAGTTGSNV